jgi:uncharacterized protein YqgC (DUF456 family)
MSSKFQPALLGGLVLGVLSALPVVGAGNCCCCLWVISGGVTAAYLLQKGQPAPIEAGDGALVGLLAGVIGVVVWQVLAIPVTLLMGPFQARLMERLLSNAELPENVRPLVEMLRQSTGFSVVGFIIGAFFTLVVGIVFSTVGGLLGAALFRTKLPPVPPIPPPESPGFMAS